ncbi:MAG: hypothetical protein QOE31_1634 [Solirubrobacteraceae bacterium]|jgi:hypothetical protein|nr:hypothetical protein [Solirubrobacteraceae bacterium]
MQSHALLALSQGWTDSIGLLFTFAVLMPAVATVCIVVSIISGRGEQSQNKQDGGRWGRDSSPDSE